MKSWRENQKHITVKDSRVDTFQAVAACALEQIGWPK